MHSFSFCKNCGSAVDLHDTFKDECVECGCRSDWDDSRERQDAWLAHCRAIREEEEDHDFTVVREHAEYLLRKE